MLGRFFILTRFGLILSKNGIGVVECNTEEGKFKLGYASTIISIAKLILGKNQHFNIYEK